MKKEIVWLIQKIYGETSPDGKKYLDELIKILLKELGEIRMKLIIEEEK